MNPPQLQLGKPSADYNSPFFASRVICRADAKARSQKITNRHELRWVSPLALVLLASSQVKPSLDQPTVTENPETRREELRREILGYYNAHPDAKDTPGGILKWWFPANPRRWRVEEVAEVLESMTARGWLISRRMRQAERIYSLNKEKLGAIETFLAGRSDKQRT